MAKRMFFAWMIGLVLLCVQSLQAQSGQSAPVIPVKALVFEHKLNFAQSEDLKQMEAFATFLKEKYGKSNRLVYLADVQTYACLDRAENSEFLKNMKDEIAAKFQFVSFKEMDEESFGKRYPSELSSFNTGSGSRVYMKENIRLSEPAK